MDYVSGIRNEVAILDSRGWVWAGLRVDKASEGRGAGKGEKNLSPFPAPLARFVNPQPGPDLAARIQDGDLITNSVFFDHPPPACRLPTMQSNFCVFEEAVFLHFRIPAVR